MRRLTKMLCLLALLGPVPLAYARTPPIYHCIGAHGEPVFSGQPCGTPAPMPSAAPTGHGMRPHGACARSPLALQQGVARAFADHDVNRLAGWILWRGMDQASARVALRSLSAWVRQPLTGIEMLHAIGPPTLAGANGEPSPAGSGAGLPSLFAGPPPTDLRIAAGRGAGGTRTFGVVETGGCWWLTF